LLIQIFSFFNLHPNRGSMSAMVKGYFYCFHHHVAEPLLRIGLEAGAAFAEFARAGMPWIAQRLNRGAVGSLANQPGRAK
jgi:hypothetical protein